MNGLGADPAAGRAHARRSGGLLAVQEAVARQIVEAVAGFDNVYIEICNEPYATQRARRLAAPHGDGASARGGDASAAGPDLAERRQPRAAGGRSAPGHLDLQLPLRDAAGRGRLECPPRRRDRRQRDRLPRHGGRAYRTEAWDFILAGGGLYNNLDYSFTVGHEDGTFVFPSTQPGGGGVALRRQLGILRQFIDRFDLLKVRPAPELVVGGVPDGGSVQVLAQGDDAFGVYLRRQTEPVVVLRAVDGRARAARERHVSDSRHVERRRAPDRRRPRADRGLDRPRHEDGHGGGRRGTPGVHSRSPPSTSTTAAPA